MSSYTDAIANYDVDFVLRTLLSFSQYDPDSGTFVRTYRRRGNIPNQIIGQPVGFDKGGGYIWIYLVDRLFHMSSLVWAIETGTWPQEDLDHRNGQPGDNRFENLRVAGCDLNNKNKKLMKNNKTGHNGITISGKTGKYIVEIRSKGSRLHWSQHDDLYEAVAAKQTVLAQHPEWGFTERHGL